MTNKDKKQLSTIHTDDGTPDGHQVVKEVRVSVQRYYHGRAFDMYIMARNVVDNSPLIARARFEHDESDMGSYAVYPFATIKLPEETVQSLMDELWRAGIRPSNIQHAGELIATQKHLEDVKRYFEDERTQNKMLLNEILDANSS